MFLFYFILLDKEENTLSLCFILFHFVSFKSKDDSTIVSFLKLGKQIKIGLVKDLFEETIKQLKSN